jgi:hypothetical protein
VEQVSYLEKEMTKFRIFRYAAILSMMIATQAQAHGIRRHVAAAPSWSAACVTYHGATVCGESVSIYGARGGYAGKKNALPAEADDPHWIGD